MVMMLGEIDYEDLYYSKNSIIVNKTTEFNSTLFIGKSIIAANFVTQRRLGKGLLKKGSSVVAKK